MAGIELCKFTHGLGLYTEFQPTLYICSGVVKGYRGAGLTLVEVNRKERETLR
jgi:hypothetical protein